MLTKIIKFSISLLILAAIIGGGYFAYGKMKKGSAGGQKASSIAEIKGQELGDRSQEIQSNQSSVISNQEEKIADGNQSSVIITNNQQSSINNQQKIANDQTSTTNNQQSMEGKIVQKPVSFGFQKSSGRTIKAVIIHTSYNALGGDSFDFSKVMQEWKDAGVAPHYAIDRSGTVYQLVTDQNIAWHAGNSKLPDGTTDVNGTSIGIEVVNDQNSKFSDAEYAALNNLLATLKKKYPIKYILGHDDIAPGRKTDPWGMEWGKIQK